MDAANNDNAGLVRAIITTPFKRPYDRPCIYKFDKLLQSSLSPLKQVK